MILKNKFALIAGSALLAGSLLTGVAYAATAGNATAATATAATPPATAADAKAQHESNEAAELAQAVKDGKLTQAEADLQTQIDALRDAAMTKVETDAKALIAQAVTDGKITQAQADKLLTQKGRGGFEGGGKGRHGGGEFRGLTPDQLKAKVDAEVKAGKLTQAQADDILSGKAKPDFGRGGHEDNDQETNDDAAQPAQSNG